VEVLPPVDPEERPKGMAEVNMVQWFLHCSTRCTMPPVIAFNPAGDPSRSGIAKGDVLSRLSMGAYGPRQVRDEVSMNDFLRGILG
jgi:hypothetical protein